MSTLRTLMKTSVVMLLIVVILGLIGLAGYRVLWLTHVENYELAYKFDSRKGAVSVLPHTGYNISPPVVTRIYKVDLRPIQLCISANTRTLNCKLVKFNPAGLDLFLTWHGARDYHFDEPSQSSQGGTPSVGSFKEILTNYAFDGSGINYPFLIILSELKAVHTNQVPAQAPAQP